MYFLCIVIYVFIWYLSRDLGNIIYLEQRKIENSENLHVLGG
jgi:hypothetical protein